MKGYQIKDKNTGEMQTQVFQSLGGAKCSLGGYHYPVDETKKHWHDTLRELNWEIWEVEIKPIKKVK